MMTLTPERMSQHITDLCAAFGVRHKVVPGSNASAGWLLSSMHLPASERRFGIHTGPIVCEASYAGGLHELGHTQSPLGYLTPLLGSTQHAAAAPRTLRDVRLMLEEEHAAWDWARHYVLGGDWTVTMQQVEKICLETYYKDAARFGVRPPTR
jgi:hypothetical protein